MGEAHRLIDAPWVHVNVCSFDFRQHAAVCDVTLFLTVAVDAGLRDLWVRAVCGCNLRQRELNCGEEMAKTARQRLQGKDDGSQPYPARP